MKNKTLIVLGIAVAVLALWDAGGVIASSPGETYEGAVNEPAQIASYIWISGNDIRKGSEANTTDVQMDAVGGAKVYSGAITGTHYVYLPITLPGVLYNQNVTLYEVCVYYLVYSPGGFSKIDRTALRKQTGAGVGVDLVVDDTDYTSPSASSYCLTPTANNELNSDRGIIYLGFRLWLPATDEYIQIGGVRVTLLHPSHALYLPAVLRNHAYSGEPLLLAANEIKTHHLAAPIWHPLCRRSADLA